MALWWQLSDYTRLAIGFAAFWVIFFAVFGIGHKMVNKIKHFKKG